MPIDSGDETDGQLRVENDDQLPSSETNFATSCRPRWFQVSLSRGMFLVALAAVSVGMIRRLAKVDPTDANLAYEKAKAYHGRTATIGPNQIRIESIARNQESGPLLVEAFGSERDARTEVPLSSELVSAGPWLDVVQIELSPGRERLDVLELRIFDHHTRQDLTDDYPWCGYRVAEPNLVHLYAHGGRFPDAIDLWLRVHSYDANTAVIRLPPRLYASVMVDDFEVTITEAQNGYQGWTSRDGLMPVLGTNHSECAFVLEWEGPRSEESYQVAAISKSGGKFFHDRRVNPHLFGGSKVVVDFPIPLEQIDSLEIRRHGGRHRFFFDGVEIPTLGRERSFANLPRMVRDIDQRSLQEWDLKELRPLRVHVEVHDGDPYSGSESGIGYVKLTRDEDGVSLRGEAFTLTTEVEGFGVVGYRNRYRLRDGKWRADTALSIRSSFRASSAGREIRADTFVTPLSELKSFEIRLFP